MLKGQFSYTFHSNMNLRRQFHLCMCFRIEDYLMEQKVAKTEFCIVSCLLCLYWNILLFRMWYKECSNHIKWTYLNVLQHFTQSENYSKYYLKAAVSIPKFWTGSAKHLRYTKPREEIISNVNNMQYFRCGKFS